ncbi:hypothetical protein HYT56_01700 [Candidatus Woesearchaeota archaeon]|nr:hypothetical protein [Candidatus Woesearchaeota archaeon]
MNYEIRERRYVTYPRSTPVRDSLLEDWMSPAFHRKLLQIYWKGLEN